MDDQDVGQLQADVSVINTELTRKTLFRCQFTTNDEILQLANPAIGDYAYSAEDLLVWDYDESQWVETDKIVPDQMTPASDANPQADGTVTAGTSTEYSRGDHIHPLNTSTNSPINDTANGAVDTSVNYARSNHTHPINISSTIAPSDSTNGAVGTSNQYARSDHSHPINVETNTSNIPIVNGIGNNGTSALTGGTANEMLLADGSTKKSSIAAVNSTTDNSIKFEVSTRTGFGQLQFNQHWTNGQGASEYQYLFIPTLATGVRSAWILYFNDGVDRYGELCKRFLRKYCRYIND
ncbi:MAG: hypothetical protein EZS28_009768 [Streblomastix strix]|uniref:Uncharacterized protein n=1 Tax=Streblomastix strix TaxID=222440 RepID=A0A5J4WK55_9EUKA|nr:MAG: hypothetical protein EZS28_009768 [Streblomastix strix]